MAISQQDKFGTNVNNFIDFCKDVLKEIKGKTGVGINLEELTDLQGTISLISTTLLIRKFIASTHKYWESIRAKDHNFFDKNIGTIFGDIGEDKIKVLKYVFVESNADKEIQDIIWEYLHSFVKISINYIHIAKGPTSVRTSENGKNKIIKSWNNKEEYKDIKLVDLSANWQVELIWPNAI